MGIFIAHRTKHLFYYKVMDSFYVILYIGIAVTVIVAFVPIIYCCGCGVLMCKASKHLKDECQSIQPVGVEGQTNEQPDQPADTHLYLHFEKKPSSSEVEGQTNEQPDQPADTPSYLNFEKKPSSSS